MVERHWWAEEVRHLWGYVSAKCGSRKKGQYLLFALMLPKELRESVVVADDDASVRLVVKSVR